MRIAVWVLGTELVALETGRDARMAESAHEDVGGEEGDDQEQGDAAGARITTAGTTLAAAELGPDTAVGFVRPWRHTDPEEDVAHEHTHGRRP